MHSLPARMLRQLIGSFGPDLLDQPERVDALLSDLCGQHHRERFVLIHALREGIPQALLSQPRGTVHWSQLSRRLQTRYGFSAEAADWAVKSWAAALRLVPLSSRLPAPAAALLFWLQRQTARPGLPQLPKTWVTGINGLHRVQYKRRLLDRALLVLGAGE